jgi:hypothetical protein
MVTPTGNIFERRDNIFGFELGVIFDNLGMGSTRGQEVENVFNPNSQRTNGLPATNSRGIDCNPMDLAHQRTIPHLPKHDMA